MKTIITLAFMLIGMITMAQENIKLEEVKAGDHLIVKNNRNACEDTFNEYHVVPKGVYEVTEAYFVDGNLITISFKNNEGLSFELMGEDIEVYYGNGKFQFKQ